jgi:hypothetical protein
LGRTDHPALHLPDFPLFQRLRQRRYQPDMDISGSRPLMALPALYPMTGSVISGRTVFS